MVGVGGVVVGRQGCGEDAAGPVADAVQECALGPRIGPVVQDADPGSVGKIEGRAASIRELAKENDVPLLRKVPLAHALLRIDVNEEVPEALYDAVAETLNFVYQLRQRAA